MTYDPVITANLFRGLIYCVSSVVAGLVLGGLLILLLPKWDNT